MSGGNGSGGTMAAPVLVDRPRIRTRVRLYEADHRDHRHRCHGCRVQPGCHAHAVGGVTSIGRADDRSVFGVTGRVSVGGPGRLAVGLLTDPLLLSARPAIGRADPIPDRWSPRWPSVLSRPGSG